MVFSKKDGKIYLAFLRNMFGFWTVAKGSIDDENISLEENVIKKVKQKIGLDIDVIEKIGENIYRDRSKKGEAINKKTTYFLASSEYKDFILEEGNKGLKEVKWIDIQGLDKIKKYEELTPIFKKGLEIIKKRNG
jgi:hypothetical protein